MPGHACPGLWGEKIGVVFKIGRQCSITHILYPAGEVKFSNIGPRRHGGQFESGQLYDLAVVSLHDKHDLKDGSPALVSLRLQFLHQLFKWKLKVFKSI